MAFISNKYADYVNQAYDKDTTQLEKSNLALQNQANEQQDMTIIPGKSYIPKQSPSGKIYNAYSQYSQQQEDPLQLINKIPDQEFNIGKMAIENEYVQATNLAKQTVSDSAQLDVMYKNAQMVHDMKMNELTMKYQRTQMMFKKYQQDNTLSYEDQLKAKNNFRDANPIFNVPQASMKQEKPTFTVAQQQRGLGKILKDTAGINDKEMMMDMAAETFGPDFDQTAPEVYKYINELSGTEQPLQGQQPKEIPFLQDLANQTNEKGYSSQRVSKAIQDYNGLGGHQTEQGQQYKKKVLSQFDQPQQQQVQQAPHQALTAYWSSLPEDEKQEIILALKKNPNNINIILKRLKGGK